MYCDATSLEEDFTSVTKPTRVSDSTSISGVAKMHEIKPRLARRLDAAIKHDYRELNLGSNNLKEVSLQVFRMKSLETLILSLPAC